MKSLLYRAVKNGLVYSIIVGISVVNVPVCSLAAAAEQVTIDPALPQADDTAEKVPEELSTVFDVVHDEPVAQTEPVVVDNDASMSHTEEPVAVDDNPVEADTAETEVVVIDNDTSIVQVAQEEPVAVDNDVSETAPPQAESIVIDNDTSETAKSQAEAIVVIDNDESIPIEQTAPIVVETIPEIDDSEPVDGMTMLYIVGGATLALGAVIALGSSSGGSDDSSGAIEPDLPDPTIPPVGPDMNGDWSGFLQLKQTGAEGYQGIVASIVHEGNSIRVSTSSTLDYGRYFNGTISSSGYILMYDSITGEDWTTHKGNASSRQMDMYDYVNNFKDLDRMLLTR